MTDKKTKILIVNMRFIIDEIMEYNNYTLVFLVFHLAVVKIRIDMLDY